MASVAKRIRNGRTTYEARWRDHQGRQRKKSFTKKGDADRYAATVEADKLCGTYVEPSKITVAEYARSWAETRPHRPTTARRTEMMIRLHIAGTRLGGRKLADVRPSEVQGWATDRSRMPGPTTVRQAVGLLRSVYGSAVRDRLVASSPVVRHDLRHHYASVLLAAGESVVADAERLGHEDASLVLSTYGHLMPDSDDRTRSAIDAAWTAAGESCAPAVPQDAESVR